MGSDGHCGLKSTAGFSRGLRTINAECSENWEKSEVIRKWVAIRTS